MMRDNSGPRAVLDSLERVANRYDYDCRRLRAEISVKQGQPGDDEARLGKPFAHKVFMRDLAELRDQLKIGLSEKPPEGRCRWWSWPGISRLCVRRTPSRPLRSWPSGRRRGQK